MRESLGDVKAAPRRNSARPEIHCGTGPNLMLFRTSPLLMKANVQKACKSRVAPLHGGLKNYLNPFI